MNDVNDFNQPQPTPEAPPAPGTHPPTAFCQQCGKPLTPETVRRVGSAVFCEPCLAARLGQNPAGHGAGPAYSPGYGPVYGSDEWIASRLTKPGPNPGLAALLGLIPGVGAFYNEQYAKGVVHVVVFMVLVSLSDNVNGIFGLLVAAWIFYMAIEAHHTARARRDGTPLPNPFGLNDIGERLGFGKAWPAGPSVAEVANDAAAAAAAAAARASAKYPPPPVQPWGSPTDYTPAGYTQPPTPNQAQYTQPFVDAAYAQAYRDMGYGQYPGPQTVSQPTAQPGSSTGTQLPPHPSAYPPYTPVPPYNPAAPYDPAAYPPPPPTNRFPAGAVVLIGLGTIFLLTTTGIFSGFPPEALAGCVLLGIGAWVFLRGMTESGLPLASDGSPSYTLRVLRALKWAVWLTAVGILNLLNAFHILAWHYSWPFLVILLGVSILVKRTAYQAAYNHAYANPAPAQATVDSTKGAL
jgi:hypothetical protein